MASEVHLKILREAARNGIEKWNKWRDENETFPDLSGADLSVAELSGADLSGANLGRANLADADLTGADFTHANLSATDLRRVSLVGADLRFANCSGSNLSGAFLGFASLGRADLIGADLKSADLGDADISDANLGGADLRGADLSRAFIIGADLSGANLAAARLWLTTLGNLDLSQVNGLDSVIHLGPSTVGIDTIYKSKGKIPEVFLKGCGVPDNFIDYTPSLVGGAVEFYSCRISYAPEDSLFARRLHDGLQGRGIRCWLDDHQGLPGKDIYNEGRRGIRLPDKVLLCASEHSLKSRWVDGEISRAFNIPRGFETEQDLMKARGRKVPGLIPLNLDEYLFSGWTSNKATLIKEYLAADFAGWETDDAWFEEQFERVLKALRMDQGREPAPNSYL
jgi:TIR domain-containing protein/pentapeptide repeat protein